MLNSILDFQPDDFREWGQWYCTEHAKQCKSLIRIKSHNLAIERCKEKIDIKRSFFIVVFPCCGQLSIPVGSTMISNFRRQVSRSFPSSASVRSSIPTVANLRQHPAKLNDNEKRGINIDVTYKPPKSCSAAARPNFEAGFCPTLCFSVTSSRSFMAHRHDHLYPPDPPLAQTILAATRRMHPLSATLFSISPHPHPVLSFISRILHIMDETPLLINETLFLTDEV
jgi:hypothetical protein